MATLYCSCEQKRQIWGEFWCLEGKHDWIFSTIRNGAKPTPSSSRSAPLAGSD